MNATGYLSNCVDSRTSALAHELHQFSYADLGDIATRVAGEFLLLFSPIYKLESLHGIKTVLRASTRWLEGQFQLLAIGKPTARRGSAKRT